MKYPKAKGSKRENELKHVLAKLGYYVLNAKGSFGVYELVAFKLKHQPPIEPIQKRFYAALIKQMELLPNPHCLLIQVKSNRRPSKKEIIAMSQVDITVPHTKIIAIRLDYSGWILETININNKGDIELLNLSTRTVHTIKLGKEDN